MEIKELSKKAGIESIFFFIVTMLGLAIFIIIVAYTIPQITDGLKETELNDSSAVRSIFAESDKTIDKLDPVFLIIFSGCNN